MPFLTDKSIKKQVPFLREDRERFFSNLCVTAEIRYNKKPRDTKNLSIWGEALMGLAVLDNNIESQQELLRDAMKKLKEALSINPKLTDTHHLLGLAYHKHANLTKEHQKAVPYYRSAYHSFTKARDQDPENGVYSEWMKSCHPCPSTHESWHDIRLRIMTKRPIIPTSDEEADGLMTMMGQFGWMAIVFAVAIVGVSLGRLLQLL